MVDTLNNRILGYLLDQAANDRRRLEALEEEVARLRAMLMLANR